MSDRCFEGHLFRLNSCDSCQEMILNTRFEKAMALARELNVALEDPKRWEWGDCPWEHLEDAESDVRKLIDGLVAADALMSDMVPMDQA